jgi:type I restriction enzyme S subunit
MKAGYKQSEVGVIPEEWEIEQLSEISKKITDGEHVTPKRTTHGYYLLSARNVLDGRVDVSDVDYVGTDEYIRIKQRCGPEAGDILISCSGTIGRVTVVPPRFECVLVRSAALAKLDRSTVDSYFIQYWLQANNAQGQIYNSVNQGAQPNLFLNHIERLKCPIPPLPEQRAIAGALSDVDALLGALDQLIAKKRDLKRAAMQQLLTGQTRLPGFHGEWKSKSLDTICSLINGRAYNLTEWKTSGTPVIRLQNLTGGESYYYSNLSLPAHQYCGYGDLLYMWSATFGPHIWKGEKAIFHYHIWKVEPRAEIADKSFIYHKLHEITVGLRQRATNGGTMLHLTKASMEKLPVMIPPTKDEQTAIAEVLSDMDAELAALEQRRAKTRALKQGMMQELLTGKTRLI